MLFVFVLTVGDTNGMLDISISRCRSGGIWIDDDIVDATRRKQNNFEIQCLELSVRYVGAHGLLCMWSETENIFEIV